MSKFYKWFCKKEEKELKRNVAFEESLCKTPNCDSFLCPKKYLKFQREIRERHEREQRELRKREEKRERKKRWEQRKKRFYDAFRFQFPKWIRKLPKEEKPDKTRNQRSPSMILQEMKRRKEMQERLKERQERRRQKKGIGSMDDELGKLPKLYGVKKAMDWVERNLKFQREILEMQERIQRELKEQQEKWEQLEDQNKRIYEVLLFVFPKWIQKLLKETKIQRSPSMILQQMERLKKRRERMRQRKGVSSMDGELGKLPKLYGVKKARNWVKRNFK